MGIKPVMRQDLICHRSTRSEAVTRIEAAMSRPRPGTLELAFYVTGSMDEIRLPTQATSTRRDELWKHTCFEAFLRAPGAEAYFEFNFSPSGAWAGYRFDGYRQGMFAPEGIVRPAIELRSGDTGFEMKVSVDLGELPELVSAMTWQLGASVVIEDVRGETSYWALAHPPGKADFHHAAGFACELKATEPL